MNIENFRVMSPMEFSGSVHGDYGYQINGVMSENGYVSRCAASNAMYRRIERMESESRQEVNAE